MRSPWKIIRTDEFKELRLKERQLQRCQARLSEIAATISRNMGEAEIGGKKVYLLEPEWFSLYEASLEPQVRFMDTKLANAGIENLMCRARPVVYELPEDHLDQPPEVT